MKPYQHHDEYHDIGKAEPHPRVSTLDVRTCARRRKASHCLPGKNKVQRTRLQRAFFNMTNHKFRLFTLNLR